MSKEYAMPILTVYDENGNEIAVPAITGKSAYQYAVANGYTGTEAEFAAAMNPNNLEARIRAIIAEELAQQQTN